MTIHNPHEPTEALRQRVSDLATAGIPKYLIARIIGIAEDTLSKHYDYQLTCGQAETVERITKVVATQAQEGDGKAQALYLKTQGAKFGWVEKQVVETVDNAQTTELLNKVKQLEDRYSKEF